MLKLKSYKFKLVPAKEQDKVLFHYLGTTRFIYNLCLEYKKTAYKTKEVNISKNEIQKELKDIRNETPWIKDIHSQVVQEITDRLFVSYDNFFRRVKSGDSKSGFPKFAKKSSWSSFKFKQGVKTCTNTNKISLPGIGKIKFRKSQEIIGQIKTASIKREFDGWYVSLSCETEIIPKKQLSNLIGIDLGLKELAITSEGEFFGNIKSLKSAEKKLSSCQRNLSRKKKGSNNKKKNIYELQKLHAKVSRIRKDYLHKVSSQIINDNQVIVCEKLNTKGMLKNHKLAKGISDASWSMLIEMLRYKAKWYGRTFIQVAPHHTSQDCHICGYRNSELTLAVREWECPTCKTFHDRDVNAAKNILNKGINKLKEAGHVFFTFGDMVEVAQPAEEPFCTENNLFSGSKESHVF